MYPAWRGLTIFRRQGHSGYSVGTGHMHLSSKIIEGSDAVIVAPSSPSRANMFSMCFSDEDFDFGLLVEFGDGADGVTFDDAYTDEMDMIGIGRILDTTPHKSYSTFGVSMLEMDGDDSITDVAIPTPQTPTTPIHDIDDVGDPDDPLSGQSDCDPDLEERKVTPVSSSTESYLEVFAWSYEDMPGLDPSIVKEEIQKQLSVDFLSVVEYPEWLANVVLVPKKNSKVRVCVDFMNLNKASPKDDFPFLHIDMLVDSIVGHSMLSFMDGFSRYNQILMALKDMEKTSFISKWGTYCYKVMLFGLKNAGATYQRATTTLFHDMMHKDVETVQTMIKSQEVHLWGNFWEAAGHIVNERGIEVDPEKIRDILDMLALRIERERDKSFLGRLQYISHFITSSRHGFRVHVSSTRCLGKEQAIYYLRWRLYFDGAANQSGFGIGILLISPLGDHIPGHNWRSTGLQPGDTTDSGYLRTRDEKLKPYHAYLDLLIDRFDELRFVPAYCCLIGDIEDQVELPWYYNIHQFLAYGAYPESATAKDMRALRQLATKFVICRDTLYRGHQMAAVSPKSSSGQEYILVAIDYFTKWVEAASYDNLTAAKVAKFIRSHIICRYEIPHELISDRGVHFRGEVDTLVKEYGATPFSLEYGMEVVLPIEIKVGSLK
ncbi:Transposon Ty3-G Gag-Pol polyprotein [Vitis vinifera]|uniref:Transposon Ty3-G Gag-Pol polyprotein n=1 Tax=Vitis vinifera TaxID=29760 RepID=A0A438HM56_VITVI|nr:Transposon Ty3-G Gag-Pol polyprotein [Vitis vinifera]